MTIKCVGNYLCVCVSVNMCAHACLSLPIVVMSDKLFVLPYKYTVNWAAKTHILLSRPDSLPTCYSHNTQIRVLSVQRLWETHSFVLVHLRVSLSGSLQPCGFHCLWEQQGRNCAFAWAQPYLWRMYKAGAGCCCATGPWEIFSECRLVTFGEESAADEEEVFECNRGDGLWIISLCQHVWRFLPAAATALCICPHLSVHLWVSGSYLSCQTLSQNNCAVLLMGLVQEPTHIHSHTGHFTPLKRCGHPSQTHALTVSLNTLLRPLHNGATATKQTHATITARPNTKKRNLQPGSASEEG